MKKKKPAPEPTLLELLYENQNSGYVPEGLLLKFSSADWAKCLIVILGRIDELQNEIYSLQSGKADKQYRDSY